MYNTEKMRTRNWQELIRGCFAGSNAPFGVHPNDEARAIKMLHLALCQGASMSKVIEEVTKFLKSQGGHPDHIKHQIKLIKSFRPNPFKAKIKKKKAWLVTWENAGKTKKDNSEDIVSIFDSRKSATKVKEFVEQYYISENYSLFEKATYATKSKNNPYPAEFEQIEGGGRWQGRITCGHNPFLFARVVENLVVVFSNNGNEVITWEEQPKPSFPKL